MLGLQLGNGTEVSYSAASTGATTSLSRNVCSGGNLTSSTVMAHDVPASVLNPATPPVTIQCTSTSTTCADVPPNNTPAYQSDWQPALGVIGVSFNTIEPASKFSYQLVATPLAASSSISVWLRSRAPRRVAGSPPRAPGSTPPRCASSTSPRGTTRNGRQCRRLQRRTERVSRRPFRCRLHSSNTPFTLDFCMSVKAIPEQAMGQASPARTIGAGCMRRRRPERLRRHHRVAAPDVCLPARAARPSWATTASTPACRAIPPSTRWTSGSTATINITNIAALEVERERGQQLGAGDR